MGTVYLTRDLKHGRLVAVKVVSSEAVSGIGVEQFLKEIGYTARLEHPHILPLYDSGGGAGHPYYVMPYMKEGPLRDHLNNEARLPVAEAIAVARDVARALTHAHEHHIVHYDVKPENILLSNEHAYVADFGTSRAIHAEAYEWGSRMEIDVSEGTPAYVSPEQAAGERALDGQADVYSLGCVVYEMLSGVKPFEGSGTTEVVSKRFAETVPDVGKHLPQLPTTLCGALARAMAVNREKRTTSPAEFMVQLESCAKRLER